MLGQKIRAEISRQRTRKGFHIIWKCVFYLFDKKNDNPYALYLLSERLVTVFTILHITLSELVTSKLEPPSIRCSSHIFDAHKLIQINKKIIQKCIFFDNLLIVLCFYSKTALQPDLRIT